MKRHKEPTNVEIARKINLRKSRGEKYVWVPCIVCGDLCPQQYEGTFADCDEVHLTCKYDAGYPALAKKLEKQRIEKDKLSLFDET